MLRVSKYLFLILLLSFSSTYAQERDSLVYEEVIPEYAKKNEGFSLVDKWASYPNGEAGVFQYIKMNLIYNEEMNRLNLEGGVTVNYIVNEEGSITKVNIIKGFDPNYDKEIVRVIQSMKNWKAAEQRGKKIKTSYVQIINFESK